jgi:hypothetical protein
VKLRVAAICALLFFALTPMAGTLGQESSAVALDAHGWWNKAQALPAEGDPTGLGVTTVPTVPAPPSVPEDGLYVSNDASGAAAIAAVRYGIGEPAGGTLTLHLAEGSTLTGAEEIVACPAQGGFEPAQNGRWDAKPAYDEAQCTVEGVASDAGDVVTFAVTSSFASSLGDVAVVVAPKPGSATPFSLAFVAPTDADFAVSGGGGSSSSAYSPPATFSSGSGSSFSAPSGSGSFTAPSAPSIATPTTVAPSAEVAAPGAPVATTPVADVAPESKPGQLAAIALLVAIGGALWWLSSRPQRTPRLLGSIGSGAAPVENVLVRTSRPRGVGRFARPRSAPPTAI